MKQISTPSGLYVVPQEIYDRSSDKDIIKALENLGEYQPWIDKWAEQYSKPNTVILDVGANIGSKILPFSRLHGGNVHVIGFEPVAINQEILKELVRVNELKNVELKKLALSNSGGEMAINFPSSDSHLEAVRGQGQFNKINKDDHGFAIVEFVKLDDLNIKNISFIKVDIEGHELEFLEGAKETIDRERPAIVLEIFNSTKKKRLTESAQRKNEQCLSLMKSYGYKQIARKNKDVLFIR